MSCQYSGRPLHRRFLEARVLGEGPRVVVCVGSRVQELKAQFPPWKAHEIKDFRDRVLVVHVFHTTAATIQCSDFGRHEVIGDGCGVALAR